MKLDKTFTRWLLSALMMLVVSLSAQGVYAKCLTPPGDIDGSTKTNVNDVQCEILMTLWVLGGKVAPLPICLKAEVVDADINCDGALNVSDVQLVIQLALGAQLSPLIDGDGDGCADLCDFDTDGDGEPNLTDCSPFDPAIFPGAPEVCNGHDDDCDGARDEEVGVNAVKCSNDDVCDGVEICAGLPGSPGLVISELMINPAGPDAADDGFLEWIEIFNAGPTTIDLRNYVIKDNSGQFHQITAPNPVLAEAGGFAILARNGDYLANGGVYVDYVYSGFTMANTVDAVVLTNPVGVEVDRVEYNTALGWTIPNGASISVVNVAGNNNLAANWAASAAPWRPEVPANPPDPAIPASDLGTPGGPGVPPTLLCQDNPALVCTDGNACNGIETCHAVMGCQNGTPPNCDDGLACTTDSCSPGANDTHTCNNILTPDSCEIGGACIAGGTENPANQCEICNPAVNGTDWSPKSNGTACNNDSNGCTVGDSCQNGTCTTGATEDCDDGLTCTTDSCTSTGSGSFTCNNILGAGACLIGGACFADGAENPGNQCQICDDSVPDAWTNKANGTACNADSSGCTINDACSAGVCTAGSAAVCNDNLTCTTDSCVSTGNNTFTCDFDLNAGNCLIGGVCFAAGAENPDNQCQMCDATVPDAWTNKGNGTACNADDSGCTVDDACADGVCTAGSAAVCNDNLACTTDSCVSSGDNTFTCDFDLNAGNCLIDGGCFAAGAGNPNNQCELCDPGVIETSWTDLDDGTACNADNDGCTTNDACFLGNCTAGAAPNCNDNLACTTDSCNSTGDNTFVCVNDLDAGNCLIGGVCFADGAENPDNQCQMCDAATNTADWTDKSNGTACNADDSGCTVDDTCADGVCTAGSAAVCDDNLTCTTDSCVSTGDNTFTCDFDLDAGNCLIGDVCFADGAENPDNQCQICDAAVPDAWTDKSNGTACNADSSGCTVDDACADGVCTAGSAAVCNDNLTCTTDSCVSTGDNTFTCDFDLDAGNCLIGGVCFAAGAENPDNQCQMCDATVPDAWTDKSNGTACNADDSGCTVDDTCADGVCTAGSAAVCDDNLTCTTDSCVSTGDNTFTCDFDLNAGNCLIGDVCFADGAENPDNQCQICDAAVPDAWTDKSNGTACNADSSGCTVDDACADGVCTAGSAAVCNDNLTCTTDSCVSTGDNTFTCDFDLDAGNCLIGGVCFAAGAENPDNQCQMCDAAVPDAWTDKSNGTACNADDSGCTVDDTCADGVCTAGSAAVCDDNLTCTTDSCVSTGDNTFTCDFDLNAGNCLIGDVCFADGAENPDNQCQICDAAVPDAWTDKSNGTACNADSSGCTVDDACADGVCTAGSAAVCNDNLTCTTDSCVSTGDNTFTCDFDLDAGNCLIGGVCFAAGAENPDNQCQMCDATVPDAWTDKSNGTACNADDSGCTVDDACADGVCTAGAAPDCDDNLTCTTDSCSSTGDNTFVCVNELQAGNCTIGGVCFADGAENPANQCQICDPATSSSAWTNKSEGTLCNDGVNCTENDACSAGGVCQGTAIDCSGLSDQCNLGTCEEATGTCFAQPINQGMACDDSFACTVGDRCLSGTCTGVNNSSLCDDTNGCTTNVCQPTNAAADAEGCIYLPNSLPCSDGDACTLNDTCAGGTCQAGPLLNCNDLNECTADECNAGNCTHTPQVGTCDNANQCTIGVCSLTGLCLITPVVCIDGNVCTSDTCEPTQGCVYPNLTNGTICDDDEPCTLDTVCTDGACGGGIPNSCDDGNPCTADSCIPGTGCQNVIDDNLTCDDGDLCTTNVCITGVCTITDSVDCTDINPCTIDVCNPITGLCDVFEPNGTLCEDGDQCTGPDICIDGNCSITPIDECFTPTVNVLCVMYGPAGTIFDCEILLAKSEAGAFALENAATGLQVLLEYDETQVTLQGFVDEICFGPGLCFEYTVGAPGFPNAIDSGHTLATQPEELVDWDGGGQFLLADTSTTSNLLSDAYLTAGVGTDMNNDPLVMRARFVFDVDIPVDAPVFLFAPDIAASDENATPLDYEVYDRVIVTSPYTVLCANPGGPCDDGDPCTIDDICVGGVCVSGDSIDGAPCDDGDQCTFQDACINGSCTTSPLPECTDGTQLMCAITGAAGSSFTCSLNVANGSALDLPATGLQLDIAYPNSVVLTGFYDGEVCLPACQPWTIPNPFPMLQSGHAVFLSPLDPSMWTTGGEFWLLHFSDPTTPISDAVIDGGGVLQGDPIVVQAFFDIVVDIPSSSPALVTVSDVKPVDQNASLLNFSFQNLLMTTSEP